MGGFGGMPGGFTFTTGPGGGMGGMGGMGGGRPGGMAFDPNDLIRMMFSANSMGGGTGGGPQGFEQFMNMGGGSSGFGGMPFGGMPGFSGQRRGGQN
jgi:hypothetical protein